VPSLGAAILGYTLLAVAAAAMAIGAAGLFGDRLRSIIMYSGVLQAGYVALALAAGLVAPRSAGLAGAVFQAIAGACGIGLMWIATRALLAAGGDAVPPNGDTQFPAWAVFCFVVACMSLVGLPPLAGLPAKIGVLRAGLREPAVLFLATCAAAGLGAVSLWAYGGIALRLIQGPVTREPAEVGSGLRVLVDVLVAILIGLGLAPYIGFALGSAFIGGR
jgi:formate hydrogenlyase subunit 3/multisubunit Na+/H+ antiporter MnhD subunit